jgi:hypothetical protein
MLQEKALRVGQVCNLLYRRFSICGRRTCPAARYIRHLPAVGRPAGCKPAIQQRYSRLKICATNARAGLHEFSHYMGFIAVNLCDSVLSVFHCEHFIRHF